MILSEVPEQNVESDAEDNTIVFQHEHFNSFIGWGLRFYRHFRSLRLYLVVTALVGPILHVPAAWHLKMGTTGWPATSVLMTYAAQRPRKAKALIRRRRKPDNSPPSTGCSIKVKRSMCGPGSVEMAGKVVQLYLKQVGTNLVLLYAQFYSLCFLSVT